MNKYSPKLKSQILASKKIDAIDHGLAKAVSITPTSSTARQLKNIVLLQLLRSRSNSSDKIEVYFWKNVQKRAQLDFEVSNDSSKLAIQVRHDVTDPLTRDRELRAFALARLGEEQ